MQMSQFYSLLQGCCGKNWANPKSELKISKINKTKDR